MGHSSTITTTTSLEYNTVNNNNEPVTSKRELCDNIVKNGSSANIDSMNNNVNFNNNVIKSAKDSIGNSDSQTENGDNTTGTTPDKEYSYFGYKVEAKLKFLNIIGIFSIHFLFLYTLTQNPLGPSLWTYAWGKFCYIWHGTFLKLHCQYIQIYRLIMKILFTYKLDRENLTSNMMMVLI